MNGEEAQMMNDSERGTDNENSTNETLSVHDYSEKSFVVTGNTKPHKEELKKLGGKFNKNLKGYSNSWIFSKKNMEQVVTFVRNINNGEDPKLPNIDNNDGLDLPSVEAPNNTVLKNYQLVKFRIFRPREGMKVELKTNGKSLVGTVIKTESNNDVVDTVYIKFDEKTSLAVICRGRWQLWGYNAVHNIFFS